MDGLRSVIWFRKDLRLHDNPVLLHFANNARQLPVYIFCPADYLSMDFGMAETGNFRAGFLIECLNNLRCNLKNICRERYRQSSIEIALTVTTVLPDSLK